MPTTPRGLYYPTLQDDPDIPAKIQALAVSADAAIGDLPPATLYTSSGTPIIGAFNPAKTVHTLYRRPNETTDSNGLYVLDLADLAITMAALLFHDAKPNSATSVARVLLIREDQCASTRVVWQLRNLLAGGAILANTPFIATVRIDYQI